MEEEETAQRRIWKTGGTANNTYVSVGYGEVSTVEREAFQEDVAMYKRALDKWGNRFHDLLMRNKPDLEWRSLVISGDNFNAFQLLPWHLVNLERDEEGHPECDGSKCGKATPHRVTMLCQKRPITASIVDLVRTEGWGLRCKADVDSVYEYCEATEEFFDAFRKFLIRGCRDVAVVFHSASDPCSLCRGSHYHVVVSRDRRQVLDADYNWKRVRTVIARAGGRGRLTASSQRVRTIVSLVQYLSRPPRVWLGTNSPIVAAVRRYNAEEADRQANECRKRQRQVEEARTKALREELAAKRARNLLDVQLAEARREQRLKDAELIRRITEEAAEVRTADWDDEEDAILNGGAI